MAISVTHERAKLTMKREFLLTALLLSLAACSTPTKVVALPDRPDKVVPEHLKAPPTGKELYQRLEAWLLGSPK